MNVLCPNCRRSIAVPPDKVGVPGIRGRCGGCKTVFLLEEATIAMAPVAGASPDATAATPAAAPLLRPAATAVPAPLPAAPAPGVPPATPQVAHPSRAPSAAAVAPAAGAPAEGAPRPRRTAPHWRRCANHPQVKSESMCPACRRGWCKDCGKPSGTATICPECDGLCRSTAEHEAEEERARQRARSLREELPIIVRYPIVDRFAFALLVLVVWLATLAGSVALFGNIYAVLFSQGLLFAYAFTAINRVSAGNLRDYMPDVSDLTALAQPLRLAAAALIVSSGPLFVLVYLYPVAVPHLIRRSENAVILPVAHAQSDDSGGSQAKALEDLQRRMGEAEAETPEASAPAWVLPLMALALLWKVVYSPIALAVGAISRSFLSTLNPVVGVGCIRSMGGVYWEVMGIYTVLVVAQWLLGVGFGLIPFAGTLLRSFVDCYAYLVIGCTLGLAVFKKARELGVE